MYVENSKESKELGVHLARLQSRSIYKSNCISIHKQHTIKMKFLKIPLIELTDIKMLRNKFNKCSRPVD